GLDQSSGFGIVLLLADDLLHGIEPPFVDIVLGQELLYIFLCGNQYLSGKYPKKIEKIGERINFKPLSSQKIVCNLYNLREKVFRNFTLPECVPNGMIQN